MKLNEIGRYVACMGYLRNSLKTLNCKYDNKLPFVKNKLHLTRKHPVIKCKNEIRKGNSFRNERKLMYYLSINTFTLVNRKLA